MDIHFTMKIIKGDNIFEDVKKIVGEMLNIENSALTYEDGIKLPLSREGYPRVQINSIDRVIKASEGYIFVSPNFPIDVLEAEIISYINCIEADVDVKNALNKKYHTLAVSYHTNIKVLPSLKVTTPVLTLNNVKRQIISNSHTGMPKKKPRFIWRIISIQEFDLTINSTNVDKSISQYITSIFYDSNNICNMQHNSITMNYGLNLLRGYENYVDKCVNLTNYCHPLTLALSSYWSKIGRMDQPLRNISREKIYEAPYGAIELQPVRLIDDGVDDSTSIDICSICKSILFDDNYILYGNVKRPDITAGLAICPFCLHTSKPHKPLEMKYFRVFRVKFPISAYELINQVEDEHLREIYKEALIHLRKIEHINANGHRVEYVEIGTKWLGFENIYEYLFAQFVIDRTKKVCIIRLMDLINMT